MPRYTVKKNRIAKGFCRGFILDEKGRLLKDEEELFHNVFLRNIEGAENGAFWGRLSLNAVGSDEAALCIYAAATDRKSFILRGEEIDIDAFLCDPEVSPDEKFALLRQLNARRFVGMTDCLLYDLSGKYLYIALEVTGEGDMAISDIVIDSRGDNFMDTYPEVFRERNSFFHRYISIFSSIYNDFQQEIDSLPKLLDLDTCSEELLVIYGIWMGLDLAGGFLDTGVLRQLVKEAYSLNRMKGTRKAIERILEIILQEKAVIIEHNLVRALNREKGVEMLPNFSSKGSYDVTILVRKPLTEELRHQLLYILNQYKPIRTRLNIVQLDLAPTTDSNSYLGMNSTLPKEEGAILDKNLAIDSMVVLE